MPKKCHKKTRAHLTKIKEITPKIIAEFLKIEYPGLQFNEIQHRAEIKSCRSSNGFWMRKCLQIFPNLVDTRSHAKFARKLYCYFRDKKEEIEAAFNKIISSTYNDDESNQRFSNDDNHVDVSDHSNDSYNSTNADNSAESEHVDDSDYLDNSVDLDDSNHSSDDHHYDSDNRSQSDDRNCWDDEQQSDGYNRLNDFRHSYGNSQLGNENQLDAGNQSTGDERSPFNPLNNKSQSDDSYHLDSSYYSDDSYHLHDKNQSGDKLPSVQENHSADENQSSGEKHSDDTRLHDSRRIKPSEKSSFSNASNTINSRKRLSAQEFIIEGESFILPRKFWLENSYFEGKQPKMRGKEYKIKNKEADIDEKRKFIPWTEDFVSVFKQTQEYKCCSLSFVKHSLKAPGSFKRNKGPQFWATAFCKNEACTEYRFESDGCIIKPPYTNIKIRVSKTRQIKHNPYDLNRRFFRRPARDVIVDEARGTFASLLANKKLRQVDRYILESGNRDDAPSKILIRKMISEKSVIENKLDPHPLVNLQKLTQKLNEKEEFKGPSMTGYIRDIHQTFMFSHPQINHLINMTKKFRNKLWGYFDATGTVVKKFEGSKKPIFYYALVLPGDTDVTPLPVAEYLTNTHNIPSITHFLEQFVYALKEYTSCKPIFRVFETDFSIVLQTAVIKAFNSMEILRYLRITYQHSTEPFPELEKRIAQMTLTHTCSSHVIKTVLRKMKRVHMNKEQLDLAGCLISRLIHSDTLDMAKKYFQMAVCVFGLLYHFSSLEEEYFTQIDRTNLDNLNEKKLSDSESSNPSDLDTESDVLEKEIDELELDKHDKVIRKNSPYFIFFNQIYKTIVSKAKLIESVMKTKKEPLLENRFYNPNFFKYLLGFIMPYFPLWSACMLKDLNVLRNSNATVEIFFNIVKNKLLHGNLHLEMARFINIMHQYVLDLVQQQQFSNQTTRQLMNKIKKRLLENWGGLNNERKKLINRYFNDEKYLIHLIRPAVTQNNLDDDEYFAQFASRRFLDENYKDFIRRKIEEIESIHEKNIDDEEEEETVEDSMAGSLHFDYENKIQENDSDMEEDTIDYSMDMNDLLDVSIKEEKKIDASNNNDNEHRHSTTWDRMSRARALLFPTEEKLPYYKNFKQTIKQFSIDESDMTTLEPDTFINDNILNAFIAIQVDKAREQGFKVMAMEIILTSQMLSGKFSPGFESWLAKNMLPSYDCWLLPLNLDRNHWTLLVVDIKRARLTYLNSYHRNPPDNVVSGVMSLIERFTKDKSKEWQLVVAEDTPKQKADVNCGMHVCIWSYMICNRIELPFTSWNKGDTSTNRKPNDTDYARVGVAKILMNSETACHLEQVDRCGIRRKYFETLESDFTPRERESKRIKISRKYCVKDGQRKRIGRRFKNVEILRTFARMSFGKKNRCRKKEKFTKDTEKNKYIKEFHFI